jgi:hypothetical protein
VAHRGRQNADEVLALALASGQTVRGAAELAQVSERTARRRWADPMFRRRVTELRAEMVGSAVGKLADAAGMAADRLRELLSAQSEAVALSAARSILELGTRLREATEVEERLSALEDRLGRRMPCA